LALECPKITGKGLRQLQALNALVTLRITAGKINDDDVAPLSAVATLKYLQLKNVAVGEHQFTAWRAMPNLIELSIEDCRVDDEGIKRLTRVGFDNVVRLSIAGNSSITDDGFESLAFGFPSLKYLSIRGTGVSKQTAKRLQRLLPNVVVETDQLFQNNLRLEEEVSALTLTLNDNGRNNAVLVRRGECLFELGRIQEAIDDLSTVLELSEDDHARETRAKCFGACRDYERALQDVDVLLSRGVRSSSILSLRAAFLWHLNALSEALNDLDEAIAIEPDNIGMRFDRATILEALDRSEEAMSELNAIIEDEPSDADAHSFLARILLRRGNSEQAIKECESALAIAPNNIVALETRATANEAIGNNSAAESDRTLLLRVSGIGVGVGRQDASGVKSSSD